MLKLIQLLQNRSGDEIFKTQSCRRDLSLRRLYRKRGGLAGEAFGNGNLGATIKATYADQTNENSAYRNEHIFATGIELRYVTDPLYGFKLGLSMQASGNPFSLEQNERRMFSRD